MKFKYALPLIFSGLLTVNSSFAANIDIFKIVGICGKIAIEIFNLVEKSPDMDAFCTSETNNAANLIRMAGENMVLGKYAEAKINLLSSEQKMRSVEMQTEVCTQLAPLLKEFISEVVILSEELSDVID